MNIRSAIASDADDVYMWRNDDLVRKMSFNSDRVDYSTHIKWFNEALNDDNRLLFIGELHEHKIGICRFDLDTNSTPLSARVSIHMNPTFRGRGLAKSLLHKAIQWYRSQEEDIELIAEIKPENKASIQLFSSLGFVLHSRSTALLEYHFY
ncbi:GNAT family N-acetyltransferase [Agaribacter flavus]|uniref:GNAT family N-acetyltransferase n=1 Tax=Agaribacter flavus TaxID=1902781 RepID=A0ABV7FRU1_9ALTE